MAERSEAERSDGERSGAVAPPPAKSCRGRDRRGPTVAASFVRLFAAFRGFGSVARHVDLHDHAVMHQAIHRGRGRHRVLEDLFPLRERQIARQQNAAPFVTLRQQCEQDLHLFPALLNIT
jgi:hypothetical protein